MSTGLCAACGGQTVFEEELGSAICLSCGTLANPSQNILDSHLGHVDSSGRDYFSHGVPVAGGSTLKGRNGRALAGQDKEARERRNMIAMHEFISAIASSLSHPGSAPRAQAIFDQAMSRGKYRWGKKAKRTAGASLAISLREAKKSVSLRDIAFLMDEPLASIARAFTTVCSLLQLKFSLFEPAQHLPSLESHLVTLLGPNSKESLLPHSLVTALTPLIPRLPAVRNTVTSLAAFITQHDSSLSQLPSAPSACALFMLALEGELSASLPNAGALAQALGARVGVSKAVVMQRYKTIYDMVEECIKEVPWLDSHERSSGRGGKGRSKVAKRVVVAKGLKDVVQFQDEIWRRRFVGRENPVLVLEADPEDEGDETSTEGSVYSFGGVSAATDSHRRQEGLAPPNKRRKTRHDKNVEDVSRYLLQPRASGSGAVDPRQDLLQHFLTADDSLLAHAFARPPTRLQLLANERGGEGAIADDELFEDGEMDGMMRSPEEVQVIRSTMDWDWDTTPSEPPDRGDDDKPSKGKRKRSECSSEKTKVAGGKQRIDMDVLARLLDPSTMTSEDGGGLGDGGDEYEYEYDLGFEFGLDLDLDLELGVDGGHDERVDGSYVSAASRVVDGDDCTPVVGGDEEVVEEWRPMSPGGGGGFDDENRYDF